MRFTHRVTAWPLVAVFAVAGCAPALDWREVRPEGSGGLVLMLPCRPDTQSREVTLAGRKLRLTLSACTAGGQTWAVAFGDLADPSAVGPALEELRVTAARNLGAVPPPGVPLSVPGATPNPGSTRVTFEGRMPDGATVQEQAGVFTRGTFVFQVTAVGPKLPAEAAETFFAGLRFPS